MRMFARRLLTLGLVVAGGLVPAVAQRGGARGGFSGGARGGFASGGAGFRSGPVAGGRSFAAGGPVRGDASAPRMARPMYAARPGYAVRPGYAARPGYNYSAARRTPYPVRRPVYRTGYGYANEAWFVPNYLAYPYWGYDEDDDFYGEPVYDVPQDNYVESAPVPADSDANLYATQAPQQQMPARAHAPPAPEDTVTLVFKDGRPNEHIRNYMLTPTTLTVVQGHRMHDVALADLDVAATEKVNREAGVAFKLPEQN